MRGAQPGGLDEVPRVRALCGRELCGRELCGREDSNLHPSRDWDLNPVNAIFAWLRLVPDSASELAFREMAIRLMSACTTLCGNFGLQNGCSRAARQRGARPVASGRWWPVRLGRGPMQIWRPKEARTTSSCPADRHAVAYLRSSGRVLGLLGSAGVGLDQATALATDGSCTWSQTRLPSRRMTRPPNGDSSSSPTISRSPGWGSKAGSSARGPWEIQHSTTRSAPTPLGSYHKS